MRRKQIDVDNVQKEVYNLVSNGIKDKKIMLLLDISRATVWRHKSRLGLTKEQFPRNKPCKLCGNNTIRTFCSRHCAGKYISMHRTFGFKRSKIELWIEANLSEIYPDLPISYSNRSAIQMELDIYIPSLKIAFEINGPTHYSPIYGNERFERTVELDAIKILECGSMDIELHVIDISGEGNFDIVHSYKYLDIICSIINTKYNI